SINNNPPIRSACLPKNVFPIEWPSLTPIAMEMNEKKPTEIAVGNGRAPVMPALKPIERQLRAKMNPKTTDSFQRIEVSCLASPAHSDGVKLTQKPSPIKRMPPVRLENGSVKSSDKIFPIMIDTYAAARDMMEMIRL